MTDPVPNSHTTRLQAWIRAHQRGVGLLAITVGLALVAVAVLVGIGVFSAPHVGQTDPTPIGSPSAQASEPPSASFEAAAPSDEPGESRAPSPDGPPIAWPPQADGGAFFFEGIWGVSVVDDLNVRSGPGTDHPAIAQLDSGDLFVPLGGPVAGSDSSGWLQVAAEDGVVGYVNPGPAEDPYLMSTPIPWMAWYTALNGVASNGTSYVAFGTTYQHDYPQYEGGAGSLMMASDDGVTWASVGENLGSVVSVAGGPEGWVALTSVYPGVALTSFSADGRTWEDSQFLGASSVAYGPAGWVGMVGSDAVRSSDGRTWSDPRATGLTESGNPEIEGSESGYVAFSHHCCDADVATSPDGVAWSRVTLPVETGDWFSDVELDRDQLSVLVTDSDTGGSWLHRGTLAANGTVSWDVPPIAFDPAGVRVDSISHGPEGLLAFGWDADALTPVLWASSDGDVWDRLNTVPTALGGSIGPEPVWGSAGWVGVGSAVGSIGQQLWSSALGEEWTPVGPAISFVPDALPCAPISEASILTLAYSGSLAERCYGNASLIIRAWVPVIDGLGGCCSPDPAPAWLAGAYPSMWLAPGPTDQIRASLPIYIPPGIDDADLVAGTWVEVIGHFRDPAALDCSQTPRNDFPQRLGSLEGARLACAQRFVVESIVAVDGP